MSEIAPPLPPQVRRRSRLAIVLIVLATVLLVLGGLWWWYNRPIQPVVLDAKEKEIVEAKVEAIQEPVYEKGGKEIVLTERELNGLLNEQTNLGKSLSLELATGAVHARLETDLDPSLPVVGGRRLKARARFLVSQVPGQASLVLDDLTVWGISLPNDWLAGMKGRDLLGEILGKGGTAKISGVEEFKIEPGKLTVRLAE